MEPRGRGRGYGRARGSATAPQQGQQGQQQQQRPGPPAQRPPQQQGPPQTQPPGWVRPPAQPGQAWVRPQTVGGPQPQPAPPTVGRGAARNVGDQGAVPRTVEAVVTGEGDAANRGGNNAVRGRIVNRRDVIFTRPETLKSKEGSSGTPISLSANYLKLLQKGGWCLYQYRVDFAPDVDGTGTRRHLVRTATKDLIKGGYLFDGTVLYTPNRINPEPAELFVQEGEQNIRVTIRLVGDVQWGDIHYLQLFNIIMRKCLHLMGFQLVGRNYYSPDSKLTISEHKIQLWPGYFTSMRQHEQDILLNVDLQFKFMRTDNVYDMLMETQGAQVKVEFASKIIGSIVLTYYNNKTYRVDDIDWNSNPTSTFAMADGRQISYKDYFKTKYNVNIQVPTQPMLVSRSKQREIRAGMPETVYLVPELCQLTGLTDQQRDNFNLMKDLAIHTRIAPGPRIQKLMQFAKLIQSKPEVVAEIKRYDLGIADRLIQFQGRVLPVENIVGGNTIKYPAGPQADWTRDLRAKPMYEAQKMARLAVICPSRLKGPTQDFIGLLHKAAGGMKWSIGDPRIFEIQNDRAGSYLEQIEKVANSANPTLIMIVLQSQSQDRYNAIKKKCCVDRAIPTQVIVGRNLTSKGAMTIATKVAIQMNCKIGGAPWSVVQPLGGLMVVGYDVCRDTANRNKSFSGMVASLDRQLSRYFHMVTEHQFEEELSDNFGTFMLLACKKYHEVNNSYPTVIMIYRDGVGDGQINFVLEHEVENIKKRLKEEIYKDTPLKLGFVIVSKRINTRIFAKDDNPPPGTVVDKVITLPERYDFYIVSQCVRQGTVGPTSYNVIEDTTGLTPDRMQVLTYKMTHLYYNWSGTVRVPAPCQYAHKLAFLTAQNLHRAPHRDLEKLLFFL